MWTIVPAMVAVLLVFPVSGVYAQGKVYTWTDARGNVHITDTEPPAQARVTDVVEGPASVSADAGQQRPERKDPSGERARREQSEAAGQRAMEAEREAQEAVRRADEQSRYAIEYRKRYSNTSERRENFKYKIRAEEEKAEALRLEALKAIDRARSASEEARPSPAPQPAPRP
jgi:hypothetical protein